MTQIEAVRAYKVLQSLGGAKMPVQTAYKLFTLRKALQPAYEFQAEQERAIAKRYSAYVDKDGHFHTKDEADMKGFGEALVELGDAECTVTCDKPEVKAGELPDLSPDELEALDPVLDLIF